MKRRPKTLWIVIQEGMRQYNDRLFVSCHSTDVVIRQPSV